MLKSITTTVGVLIAVVNPTRAYTYEEGVNLLANLFAYGRVCDFPYDREVLAEFNLRIARESGINIRDKAIQKELEEATQFQLKTMSYVDKQTACSGITAVLAPLVPD